MLTLILIAFPFLAASSLLFFRKEQAKTIALVLSLMELLLSVFIASQFRIDSEFQFAIDREWIHTLGINFHLGIDGISLLLILLTTVLIPLIILTSFRSTHSNLFYALILFMQGGLLGVFASLDGFLFYVFWEIALIPAYLICLLWGGEKRIQITFRFFIFTLAGSLLMLAALIFLYLKTPAPHSFSISSLYALQLDAVSQAWIFWAMFIAFAIKMPVFPFHSWQPDTYTDSPSQGTMLLSGIMLKMGIYGLIRWLLPLAPLGVQAWGNTAMLLSGIGIVYASLIAWMQKDFKRLIAYSSIAHVGLIAAGVFSLTQVGLQGSMVQMISHGLVAVGLFFVCEIIFERTGTSNLASLGGLRNQVPLLATCFIIILLGSVGLPLTSGFIGEFLLLSGIFQHAAWMAGVAGISMILGAVYMLNAFQKIMLGESNPAFGKIQDLYLSEKIVLYTLVIFILAVGVFPQPILSVAEPALLKIISVVNY